MSRCFRNVTGGASGVAWQRGCEFAGSCMGGRLRVYVLGDMRCNRFALRYPKDAGGGENWLHQSGKKRSALGVALVLFNIIMMIIAVVSSAAFSVRIRTERQDAKISEFVSTIESMKKLSQTYLDSERGYVRNWASYISEQGMTLEGALQFLRSINTDPTRYVHIVDMETFRAYNFQDDYNKMYTLLEEIKQNDSDILRYKNFRGKTACGTILPSATTPIFGFWALWQRMI